MKIEVVLEKYGLNSRQIKVYLACLELGTAPVQRISQKAELIRTTVYEVLEVLRKKGLVNMFLKKKVRYYSAEDPEQMVCLAQRQVESLKRILPELNARFGKNRNKPSVRFYQGKEGIKIIMEEILKEARELISFGSADDLLREMGDYHKRFLERRIKNKIPLTLILRDTPKARERKALEVKHLRKVKLIPATYQYNGLIFIWNDKVAMFSLKDELMAMVIESDVMAQTQKAFFNSLWDSIDPLK